MARELILPAKPLQPKIKSGVEGLLISRTSTLAAGDANLDFKIEALVKSCTRNLTPFSLKELKKPCPT